MATRCWMTLTFTRLVVPPGCAGEAIEFVEQRGGRELLLSGLSAVLPGCVCYLLPRGPGKPKTEDDLLLLLIQELPQLPDSCEPVGSVREGIVRALAAGAE